MMANDLQGLRILLVEDDFLIADDLARRLAAAGAEVIGPAATLSGALALYESCGQVHAVILDINLRGTIVFPLAQRLQRDAVPFVFCTGNADDPIGAEFKSVARFVKPLSHHRFITMAGLIASMSAATPTHATHCPM